MGIEEIMKGFQKILEEHRFISGIAETEARRLFDRLAEAMGGKDAAYKHLAGQRFVTPSLLSAVRSAL